MSSDNRRNDGRNGRDGERLTIKELPPDTRPREKMKAIGPAALSESELLAIILRVGTQGISVLDLSNRLLARYGGLVGLSRVSFTELCEVHGLGEAKACQLKAALEIGRRLLLAQPEERLQVRSPADLAPLLMLEMGPLDHETLRVAILNTKNQVIKFSQPPHPLVFSLVLSHCFTRSSFADRADCAV